MSIEQLIQSSFHSMWSALHFPGETNHAGKKIIELLKYNAMSSFSKSLFDDFEKNKNFSNAATILTEMENLFIGNVNLQNQVRDALNAGKSDSVIAMPPIERYQTEEPNYNSSSQSSDSGMSFGEIINIILTIVSVIGLIAKCSR
jgi:hypothetical protein